MAINKNHEFEELNGVKCAIVEKNASKERVEFLKQLLEFNKYTVIVVPSPPPKVVAPPPKPATTPAATGDTSPGETQPQSQSLPIVTQPEPKPDPPPPPDLSAEASLPADALTNEPAKADLSADLSSEAVAKEEAVAKAETFTVGVTDVTFYPTNAVFGRLLHTPDGHVVSLAYWQQKEAVSNDEVPYFGEV